MRRIVLTVTAVALAMAFIGGNVLAQDNADLTNYGAQVGLNMAKVTGSDAPSDLKMRMGLAAGGFFTYGINDMFAIQVEAMYAMKGAKQEGDQNIGGTIYHVKQTIQLDYIEIPVLAKVSFVTSGNIKPYIFAGPYLGILASAKIKMTEPISATTDIKDNTKSTDFGLTFGAGVGMKMTKGMPFINARYDLGLTSLDKPPSGVTAAKIKNGVIGIVLGYAFK